MKVIIAEKPKLAKLIVESLSFEKFKAQDGYYEGNEYIVTYAFGHLFQLYDVEDYLGETKPWTLDNLPFCPQQFNFKLMQNEKTKKTDVGVKKQYLTIKSLCNRKDVDEIVNCGDSDREGEAIVRLIINNCISVGMKKITRLWLEEQTPLYVMNNIRKLRLDSEFDNLANEGLARIYEDWLYGINSTRYITLKASTLMAEKRVLRSGRVLTAITKAIYDRDMSIKNFVTEEYYALVSNEETNGKQIELTSKSKYRKDNELDAIEKCGILNTAGATVTNLDTKRVVVKSPMLYSTTSLQNSASKVYKLTPSDCATAMQSLYESGYISYPRTDTEYLGDTEKPRIKDIIDAFAKRGETVCFKDNKNIFDNTKITSHGALTPTHLIPTKLSPIEEQIYTLIKNRFLSVFCSEDCVVNRTVIQITCHDEVYTLKGDIGVAKGFYKYEFVKMSERELPPLKVGDIVNIRFVPTLRETKPPAHYTVTTLNNFMENPFEQEIKDAKGEKTEYAEAINGLAIGTGATRAVIIDKAIQNGYIALRDKTTYIIQDLGCLVIETFEKLGVDLSKNKTVEMSMMLNKVYKGELSVNEAITKAKLDLVEMFKNKDMQFSSTLSYSTQESVGKCPLCGSIVYENKVGYSCEKNKRDSKECAFILFKEDKYVMARTCGKITITQAKSILKKGQFTAKCQKKDKSGTYNLVFTMKMNGNYVNWDTSFAPNK